MTKTASSIFLLIFFSVPAALAAPCPPLSTLTNGSNADANQVMGNFNSLLNCANNSLAPLASPSFSGNVAIGSSPSYFKLRVNQEDSPWGVLFNGSTKGVRFVFSADRTSIEAVDNTGGGTLQSLGFAGSEIFFHLDGYGGLMWMTSAGRVGIGTSNPAYALHVANGRVAGNGPYLDTSTARTKKDVMPISYGLDAVMKLRPISFNWNDQSQDWEKQRQIGLIAQDVEPIIPEAVSREHPSSGISSLAYDSLVPVLIKAMQEQQGQITSLRQEISRLKKR